MRPGDDRGLSWHRPQVMARGRVTITRQIRFQKVAIGFCLAFQRTELHFRIGLSHGTALGRIETRAQRRFAGGGNLSLVFKTLDDLLRFDPDLRADIGQFGAELLNAWMGRQQCRGQFRELALHEDALLDQIDHHLRTHDLGRRIDVAVLRKHVLDELRPGTRLGFLRLGQNQLAVQLGKLLRVQRDIVGARIKALGRLEGLDGLFGIRCRRAERLDLRIQPGRGVLCLVDLGLALPRDIDVRERVGDLRSELRVAGSVFQRDHGRLGKLVYVEMFGKCVGRPFFFRLGRAPAKTGGLHQARENRVARILHERIVLREIEIAHDFENEVARGQNLHLALHGLLVERGAVCVTSLLGCWTRERRFFVLYQDTRFGGVERSHHR